jgi:Zn-finger nucleic acid-binding protein
MKCPKCGEEMRLVDKNTFTGEEIREYLCDACREMVIDRGGIALWQAISDAKSGQAQEED